MKDAKKGDFVKIHGIILKSGERAPTVPEDTRKVPLEMWVNGFLLCENAEIGDNVEIETLSGRTVSGNLVEINPGFFHTFGRPVAELLRVGMKARKIVKEYEEGNGLS